MAENASTTGSSSVVRSPGGDDAIFGSVPGYPENLCPRAGNRAAMSANPSYEQSKQVAEASRETEWKLPRDRKSTRLNSSHANISYAVFCLKKKNHDPL